MQLFSQLRTDETAGVKTVMNGLGSISQSVGLIYVLAALIGIVAVAVILMRSDDDEAMVPGFVYLAGIPSLISPLISAYAIYIVVAVFHTPGKNDLGKLGAQVGGLIVISFVAAVIALLILLPFTFVPFSARVGKRVSPVIYIGLVLVGIAAMAAISFWLVGYSQEPTIPIVG